MRVISGVIEYCFDISSGFTSLPIPTSCFFHVNLSLQTLEKDNIFINWICVLQGAVGQKFREVEHNLSTRR